MTHSDPSLDANTIIDRVLTLTSDDHIYEVIEKPLDQVAQQFRYEVRNPITRNAFHRVIATFITHVYQYGLRLPRMLTPMQALDEAIYLLCLGTSQDGYDETILALAEAQKEALDATLSRMLQIIKELEKQKYRTWVLAKHVNPTDWHLKCCLVEQLLQRCGPYLPERLRRFTPAQLADHYLALFELCANTQNFLHHISANLSQLRPT